MFDPIFTREKLTLKIYACARDKGIPWAIHMKNLPRRRALSFFGANIFKACMYFDSVLIIKADREIAIELVLFPGKRVERNIYIYI